MPTVRWQPRESSPHFFYLSLERFFIVKGLEDIHTFMLFLVMESLDKESSGFLSFCMTALTIISIESDLHRLRPSNFYGFDPKGAYDEMNSYFSKRSDSDCITFIA
jgi:hypothetical protein